MIFNFRLVSDEVDNFKREIKIDADYTFLDLKNAICDAVGYDKNQLCSFFLCDDGWEKETEITLEDMGTSSDEDVFLMEDQRLIFMFDYMTERSFFIEMKEMITGKKLKDPLCTLAIGKAPVQIMDIKEFETKIDAKIAAASVEDLDEEFYGADEFNEDEFEAEGFEEMTFED